MRRAAQLAAVWVVVLLGVVLWRDAPEAAGPVPRSRDAAPRRVTDLVFVENRGQWDTPARFVVRRGASTIALEDDAIGIVDAHEGFYLRLRMESARRARLEGEDPVATRFNYFLGDDPERWQSSVAGYRSVLYRGVGAGIDLRVRNGDGDPTYDVLLEAGADLEDVRIVCEGADSLRVDGVGRLYIGIGESEVRQSPPRSWEILADGSRRDVASRFVVLDERSYGFEVPGRDPSASLIVDPGLEWSTYLGGSNVLATETVRDVVLGEDGSVFVAGQTGAATFPVTPGAFDTTYNGGVLQVFADAFVARLDPQGDLVFATYLGGSGNDWAESIAWSADRILVLGAGGSFDFPLSVNAFDTTLQSSELFVTCLDTSGSDLLYSTFFGGSGADGSGTGFIDGDGLATLAGFTGSVDNPTTPDALSTQYFGEGDAFVARIDTVGGGLVYGTYLGGASSDFPRAAHMRGDLIVLAGETTSADYPVTANAFATTKNASSDVFITVIDLAANAIVYSSFLGGISSEFGRAVHLDGNGVVTVAGSMFPPPLQQENTFPITHGAFQPTASAGTIGFVSRMDSTDGTLLYSTFLSGNFGNIPLDVDVQSSGAVTVVGDTDASTFPVTPGALSTTNLIGDDETFVTRLRPDGSGLIYSTYLGGDEPETSFAAAVALDATGAAVVVGDTGSPDFPTTPDAFQPVLSGLMDGFISKLDMLPVGVTRVGTSTPGAAGPLAIGAWNAPFVGSTDFAVDCTDAPPLSTRGLLLAASGGLDAPVTVQGIELFVDPARLLAVLPVTSNEHGYAAVPVRLDGAAGAAGATLVVQFVWASASGAGTWSSTPALEIVLSEP